MTRQLLTIIIFSILVSCNTKADNNTVTADANSDSLTSKTIDPIYSFDTTFISNNRTIIFSIKDLNDDSVLLTATSNSFTALIDTINSNGLAYWDFPDINNDGNADIIYDHIGNIPIAFLYLFDTTTNSFKEVEGFENFPEAIQLKSNPKYYYSYHRAGCADQNWVSDLFYIDNFKTIQIGHIYGQGCDSEGEENLQGIEIYKVHDNDESKGQLIEKLPYSENIPDKWVFIEKYWNKNYDKF